MRMLLPLLLALLSACGAASGPCGLTKAAELPVTLDHGRPVIPVEIGGKPALLVLDTGAAITTLSRAAITRLGLAYDERWSISLRGVGGSSTGAAVVFRDLTIGGAKVPEFRGAELPTAAGAILGAGVDGYLGMPALNGYDIEMDMPHRRMALYRGRLCPGAAPPIPGPLTSAPVSLGHAQVMIGTRVSVDGKPYDTLLDTGSQASVAIAGHVLPLGAASHDRAVDMNGAGPGSAPARMHQFASFSLGDDHVPSPRFIVAEMPAIGYDMVLGMDYLAHRRFFIALSADRLFVQLPPPH